MTSKAELDRRAIRESGSPLANHSLNQTILRIQRAGAAKLFGRDAESCGASQRREDAKRQRKQALYDSIDNISRGIQTEGDVLNFVLLSEEFEKADPKVPNATIIDFRGMKPSGVRYGEPEFFRRDKK
jgi:hypothetical protein